MTDVGTSSGDTRSRTAAGQRLYRGAAKSDAGVNRLTTRTTGFLTSTETRSRRST